MQNSIKKNTMINLNEDFKNKSENLEYINNITDIGNLKVVGLDWNYPANEKIPEKESELITINKRLEKIDADVDRGLSMTLMAEYLTLANYFKEVLKFYEEIGSKSSVVYPINQDKVKRRIKDLESLLIKVVDEGYKEIIFNTIDIGK